MKSYILNIIPRIQKYSKKLDELTKMTDHHWILFGSSEDQKKFIFRGNNQLLISTNGIVEKGNWEYIGESTLLIDLPDGSFLLKNGFFDDNVLTLKLDGQDGYVLFINEKVLTKGINTLEAFEQYLEKKYSKPEIHDPIATPIYETIYCAECGKNPCVCPDHLWVNRTDSECPACGHSEDGKNISRDYGSCPDCGLNFFDD